MFLYWNVFIFFISGLGTTYSSCITPFQYKTCMNVGVIETEQAVAEQCWMGIRWNLYDKGLLFTKDPELLLGLVGLVQFIYFKNLGFFIHSYKLLGSAPCPTTHELWLKWVSALVHGVVVRSIVIRLSNSTLCWGCVRVMTISEMWYCDTPSQAWQERDNLIWYQSRVRVSYPSIEEIKN